MIEINVKAKKDMYGPRLLTVVGVKSAVEAGQCVHIYAADGDPNIDAGFYDDLKPNLPFDGARVLKILDKGYGFYARSGWKAVVFKSVVTTVAGVGNVYQVKHAKSRGQLQAMITALGDRKIWEEEHFRYVIIKGDLDIFNY